MNLSSSIPPPHSGVGAPSQLDSNASRVRQQVQSHIPISVIQQATAAYFGISQSSLLARSRASTVVWPRQVAVLLSRRAGWRFRELAESFERPISTLSSAKCVATTREALYRKDRLAIEAIHARLKLDEEQPQ